jgi:hypothetical protein
MNAAPELGNDATRRVRRAMNEATDAVCMCSRMGSALREAGDVCVVPVHHEANAADVEGLCDHILRERQRALERCVTTACNPPSPLRGGCADRASYSHSPRLPTRR